MINIPCPEHWEMKLAPPTPLVKKNNDQHDYGRALPHPNDFGKYIMLPATSTGYLELYTLAGAQSWSVPCTHIHGSSNYWTGVFWLDTIDSAIWVWTYDTDSSPYTYYLAKVALTNGLVTNIGTCQPGNVFGCEYDSYFVERARTGSRDITIRDGDYKIILNTNTGAIETVATQISQNGRTIPASTGYETEDGTIYTNCIYLLNGQPYGCLQRGGVYARINLPANSPCGSSLIYPMLWDEYIAMAALGTTTMYNSRYFNRADFDAWLGEIADYYKFPI